MPSPESFEHLREAIDPGWDDVHQEHQLQRVKRTRVNRRRSARAAVATAVVAAVGIGIWLGLPDGSEPRASAPVIPIADGDGIIRFEDGSRIASLGRDSRVVVTDVSATRAAVRLRQGSARFEISPNRDRDFVVHCAAVTVSVKGTEFDVRRDGARVDVAVYQGLVEVEWPGGSRHLRPGEEGTFPPDEDEFEADSTSATPPLEDERPSFGRFETSRDTTETPARRRPRAVRTGGATPEHDRSEWRTLATEGEYSAAYDALAAGQPVEDRVDDLMLAADAARLSGRPEAALQYLEQVSERHGSDPRAALAAFTIGRIRLGAGDARTAAQWFRTAREAQPSSSLAEHALAREIEALSSAGEAARATELGRTYLERFGDGPRAATVRQLTGL